MSRPLRIQYEGAWYHVMNRGAARKNIYYDTSHKELFLKLLDQINQKFKIEIHAYCLMSNHYHLLVRTPLPNLTKAMRYLNGVYTQALNRDRKTDGALFRGRYKAILVEDEEYLIKLSRYIHLNPVQAKICENPESYKWSSYQFYIKKQACPTWLFSKNILNRLGDKKQYYHYKLFVLEGVDVETQLFYEKKFFPIMGSTDFLRKIDDKFLNKKFTEIEIPDHKKIKKIFIPTVEHVIDAVARYYNVPISDVKKACRGQINNKKSIAIYFSIKICHVSLTTIATAFGDATRNGVTSNYKRFLLRLEHENFIKEEIKKIFAFICESYQGSI